MELGLTLNYSFWGLGHVHFTKSRHICRSCCAGLGNGLGAFTALAAAANTLREMRCV